MDLEHDAPACFGAAQRNRHYGAGCVLLRVGHGLERDEIQGCLYLAVKAPAGQVRLEPLQLAGDIGIALLGIAVVKAGAARWAGAAIAVGAIGEGAGFATSSKAVVIVSFALLFAGLLQAVRTLATSRAPVPAAAQEAAAVS
jgi:hypothetical protein